MLSSSEKVFDDLPKFLIKESPLTKREPSRQLAITEFLIKSDSRNNYIKTLNDPVRFHQKYKLYQEERIKQEVKSEKDTVSQNEDPQPLSQYPGTFNTHFSQSMAPSQYDSVVSNTEVGGDLVDANHQEIKKKIKKNKLDNEMKYGAYVFELGEDAQCSPQLLLQLGESYGSQYFKSKFHGWAGLIHRSEVERQTYYLYVLALTCTYALRGTQLFKQALVPQNILPLNNEITFLKKEMLPYFFCNDAFETLHNSLPKENFQSQIKKQSQAALKLHQCPLYNLKVVAKQIKQIEKPVISIDSAFDSLGSREDRTFQSVKNFLKARNPIVFDDGQRSLRYQGLINLFNEGKDQFRDFELLLKHLDKTLEKKDCQHWKFFTLETVCHLDKEDFDRSKRNIYVIFDGLWLVLFVPKGSDKAYLFGSQKTNNSGQQQGSTIINKLWQFLNEHQVTKLEAVQDNVESQSHPGFYSVYLLFSLLFQIEKPEGSYEKITLFKLNLFKELSLQVYGKKDA